MRYEDIRAVVRLRGFRWDRVERTLGRCVTVADLRAVAARNWPRGVRGYVEGGADDELSLRRNQEAFERYGLVTRTLRDVAQVDTRTRILGHEAALPFGLAPTGYTRMMHADGEPAVARAARQSGVPYTLSTMATTSLEDLARQVPGELWFQLYVLRDRGLTKELLERAEHSGYRVLMLTVDTAVTGLRVRDTHNGFTIPPQLSPSTVLDMARHPAWCLSLLRGEPITFANLAQHSRTPEGVMAFAAGQFDASVTWEDLAWLRERWSGPLVVKGMVSARDAVRAAEAGVDGVVLSNHGGRQLDRAVAPIEVLPEVRQAVGDRVELLVDSGIRRGTDIVIALALGADSVLVGRPYLYGLGAGGERGAAAAIRMLGEEVRRAMQLLGVSSIGQLREEGPALVRGSGL
ncbi:alpha-hydroxy acid oxidase [Streptomyces sp. NPDC056291]|uniref:alpha-hydroxy acid oxidase n=1 Tax=unclassified Streptomyces TaxID=2593676 RepID=UPI0035E3B906